MTGSRVTAAVERALDERQREATEEVERILAAAVRVMERVAPEPPRVSDIVAEAGSSNKAFYRYFAGKDDLILAVMERGVAIVVSYLQHQMAKESRPRDQVARWARRAGRTRLPILCGGVLRPFLAEFLARSGIEAEVLAFSELPPELPIAPLGTIEAPGPGSGNAATAD